MDIKILRPRREQVKVLLVLYDGGSHAKDVSCLRFLCLPALLSSASPLVAMRRLQRRVHNLPVSQGLPRTSSGQSSGVQGDHASKAGKR